MPQTMVGHRGKGQLKPWARGGDNGGAQEQVQEKGSLTLGDLGVSGSPRAPPVTSLDLKARGVAVRSSYSWY